MALPPVRRWPGAQGDATERKWVEQYTVEYGRRPPAPPTYLRGGAHPRYRGGAQRRSAAGGAEIGRAGGRGVIEYSQWAGGQAGGRGVLDFSAAGGTRVLTAGGTEEVWGGGTTRRCACLGHSRHGTGPAGADLSEWKNVSDGTGPLTVRTGGRQLHLSYACR